MQNHVWARTGHAAVTVAPPPSPSVHCPSSPTTPVVMRRIPQSRGQSDISHVSSRCQPGVGLMSVTCRNPDVIQMSQRCHKHVGLMSVTYHYKDTNQMPARCQPDVKTGVFEKAHAIGACTCHASHICPDVCLLSERCQIDVIQRLMLS